MKYFVFKNVKQVHLILAQINTVSHVFSSSGKQNRVMAEEGGLLQSTASFIQTACSIGAAIISMLVEGQEG